MTHYRQSRLRAFLLAAIVAAGAGLHCRADVVSNCFKVVNYTVNWHVECTLDGFTDALDIAIDDNTHCGARDRPCWWGLSGGVGVIDTAAANMFPEAPLMMP
jgi:hypothetical protein